MNSVIPAAAVSSNGRVVISAQVDDSHAQVDTSNDSGLWAWRDDTGLTLIAREGDPLPGGIAGTWGNFINTPHVMSPNGAIAFSQGGIVWVAFGDGLGPRRVAGPGDLLNLTDGTSRAATDAQVFPRNLYAFPNGGDGGPSSFNAQGELLLSLSGGARKCAAILDVGTPPELANISGQVMSDSNGNSMLDVGDAPYTDVTLSLFRSDPAGDPLPPAIRSLTPLSDGSYEFENLSGTKYVVKAEIEPLQAANGHAILDPANGERVVNLPAIPGDPDPDFLVTVPLVPKVTVSMHRIDFSSAENWSDAVRYQRVTPARNVIKLEQAPVLSTGVCADEVSPLLFKIDRLGAQPDLSVRWVCQELTGGTIEAPRIGGGTEGLTALMFQYDSTVAPTTWNSASLGDC